MAPVDDPVEPQNPSHRGDVSVVPNQQEDLVVRLTRSACDWFFRRALLEGLHDFIEQI